MAETVNQENTNGTEPESTPKTFTQEEVNAMMAERVKREQSKFADYEDLRKKAEKYDQAQEASKSEIQKLTEKITGLETELKTSKKNEEIRSIRDKVAKETGVPATLLTGEDEESCNQQAKAIKDFAVSQTGEIRDGGEVGKTGKKEARDEFAEWANKILK
ncbi:MAG: DUF4355 domain-containing protein [Lachnospiraceae bacterium]|nr:DUF4355 domain-containing protein [Lachnospiraceae bacterium]